MDNGKSKARGVTHLPSLDSILPVLKDLVVANFPGKEKDAEILARFCAVRLLAGLDARDLDDHEGMTLIQISLGISDAEYIRLSGEYLENDERYEALNTLTEQILESIAFVCSKGKQADGKVN